MEWLPEWLPPGSHDPQWRFQAPGGKLPPLRFMAL
jgi:hypothetical protein